MLKVNDKVWCFNYQIATSMIGIIRWIDEEFGVYKVDIKDEVIEFYEHELYRCPEDKSELLEHLKTMKKSIEYMIKDIEQM